MAFFDKPARTVRILTVTMNPTLDVATRVERLVNHEKLRCDSEAEQVGGGGINVAQVAYSLGARSTAAFTAGGWRGNEIERRLKDDGIDCLAMHIAGESRQCFTVYETSTAQEFRFILPGPSLSENEWQGCLTQIVEAAQSMHWLVLSGSLPPGVPSTFYKQVIDRVRHKGNNSVRIAVDTSGQALKDALTCELDLIKPSREELEQITGQSLTDLDSCLRAGRQLQRQNHIDTLAVSLGSKGRWSARAQTGCTWIPCLSTSPARSGPVTVLWGGLSGRSLMRQIWPNVPAWPPQQPRLPCRLKASSNLTPDRFLNRLRV
ncbi:phosphofructokinase [Orrella marina]|uniref:Phosphofructokinase n=1 Tax=Orrella marina TaxID=2163011 RepID=A0A2R4XNK1_9BURK|nr:1-phosphofructokinase family hexose kinase [Orrella marina]AWB35392.1 phosphofructokinase [Orrella marina]